jgi:hypothetical protein
MESTLDALLQAWGRIGSLVLRTGKATAQSHELGARSGRHNTMNLKTVNHRKLEPIRLETEDLYEEIEEGVPFPPPVYHGRQSIKGLRFRKLLERMKYSNSFVVTNKDCHSVAVIAKKLNLKIATRAILENGVPMRRVWMLSKKEEP